MKLQKHVYIQVSKKGHGNTKFITNRVVVYTRYNVPLHDSRSKRLHTRCSHWAG